MATTPNSAAAGNVSQQPNPELLRQFEAERDAAQAELDRAAALRRQGEEQIKQARENQKRTLDKLDAELCRMGALPPSECP